MLCYIYVSCHYTYLLFLAILSQCLSYGGLDCLRGSMSSWFDLSEPIEGCSWKPTV